MTKAVVNKESGTSFDSTDISKIKQRAGSHDVVPQKKLDVSAFSTNKILKKSLSSEFMKKNSGNGGNMQSLSPVKLTKAQQAEIASKNRLSKIETVPAFCPRPNPPNTELRRFYERGDLPIQIDHGGVANRLAWKVEIQKLDFHHYLPIFFDGLREQELPYCFVAEQGILDMIEAGSNKVLPVIPQLIIPLKTALNTRIKEIILKVLRILQLLVNCDSSSNGGPGLIGQALVPYYRQLLPVFNIFINDTENMGDRIDYSQRKGGNLGEVMMRTLEQLELNGGEDAFINIKYLIPIYQSVKIY